MYRRAESVQPRRKRWGDFDDFGGTYIVGCGDLAKIGWSANFGRRFRQLQNGLPSPMRLYTWIETDLGRDVESGLHRRFKDLRTEREWFRFEGPLVDFVRDSLDLYIDGTAATREALKEMVWRKAVALRPDLAAFKPDPLPDFHPTVS